MAEFLVEVYLRHDNHQAARLHTERVERAAADLDREGRAVRCLSSIFVPEDETFLLLLRAPSVEVVEEAVNRAGLQCEHISAAASAHVQSTQVITTKGSSMTQTTIPSELRDKQQKVWSSGDYNKIAAITVPLSEFSSTTPVSRRGLASSTSPPEPATPPSRRLAAARSSSAATTFRRCSTSPGVGPQPRTSRLTSLRRTPRICRTATGRSTTSSPPSA